MPRYANGFIPNHELVLIEGNHRATRGTAARWEALKADVKKNEGITLRITGGENAYRSFSGQQFARNNACRAGRCNDAAVPGFSSHGGSLNGRDSGAIDVNNWAALGKTKFYAYCRKHGFEPGYFDWEPWHIIDWAPYTVPAGGGGGGAPTPAPTPTPEEQAEEEEEEMKGAYYKNASGATVVIWFDTRSGFYMEFTGVNPSNNTEIARAWDTGSWPELTASVAGALKRECEKTRLGK